MRRALAAQFATRFGSCFAWIRYMTRRMTRPHGGGRARATPQSTAPRESLILHRTTTYYTTHGDASRPHIHIYRPATIPSLNYRARTRHGAHRILRHSYFTHAVRSLIRPDGNDATQACRRGTPRMHGDSGLREAMVEAERCAREGRVGSGPPLHHCARVPSRPRP